MTTGQDKRATRAASVLREEILQAGPGTFIGAEDALMSRLAVSRQTLRMAVSILTQEGLLTVRRGQRGGLYTRLPTSESVAHMASVFLRSQGADIEDLTRVNALVAAEAARLAAANPSVEARRTLCDLVEQADRATGSSVIDASLVISRYIGVLSGSPTLTLFTTVLSELARGGYAERILSDSSRIDACRRAHRALARAVADGDQDLAAEVIRKHHERLLGWLGSRRRMVKSSRNLTQTVDG
ncbi:FCD domain-containing protein [Streptomyces muensis]|uniref:FCD domain-containing protein n=1 Tax=Streptomyces muensis TaxID=1077944 RepID=A0A9X1PS69_STRM4|nr:FCD domain-containing protein [Streptomyces muensis]MCF1592545.1 FCD domain-containing protein [Streptomyces muensis]